MGHCQKELLSTKLDAGGTDIPTCMSKTTAIMLQQPLQKLSVVSNVRNCTPEDMEPSTV